MKGKVFLTILLVFVLALTLTASAFAKGGNVQKYRVTLEPLNDSGVTGMAVLTRLPGQLKVQVWAYGLAPHRVHMQHIHGFMDGSQAMVPTAAADTNGDGYVDLAEALPVTGPVLLALEPYPTAKKVNFIVFTWVYRGAQLKKLMLDDVPLSRRVVVLHGGYWSPVYGEPQYSETLPVAAGKIVGPMMR